MNGQVRILGVGSLLHVKRWDRLLMAASSLQKRGFDFQIEICGGGPLHEPLKHQAQILQLSNRVRFMGSTKDVAKSLANSSFLVHASESEGCPNAVMEAMGCGRAVIAMDAGDISSLVEDGETGFVVRQGDDAAFADRIARLITDRKLGVRLGQAGRAKAEREFGASRLVNETLAVYSAAGWVDFCA